MKNNRFCLSKRVLYQCLMHLLRQLCFSKLGKGSGKGSFTGKTSLTFPPTNSSEIFVRLESFTQTSRRIHVVDHFCYKRSSYCTASFTRPSLKPAIVGDE